MSWYTPAETYIHPLSFMDVLLGKRADFEKDLCSYLNVDACMLAVSGRALLTLLLKALKAADNDGRNEVLIPGYTCYSVAASVARAGLKISLYDIEPKTLRPDPESLSKAAGDKTLAIIYQHLFGIPQPIEDFQAIASRNAIPIIEDAAQGFGGYMNGIPLGTMGDFGVFSFGRGKPLPIGEGGALVEEKELLDKLPMLSSTRGYDKLMQSMAVQVLSHPYFYGMMETLPLGLGKTIFDPEFPLSPMSVSMKRLAKRSLSALEKYNNHRRTISNTYKSQLDKERTVPEQDCSIPVYTRFPLLAGPKEIRKNIYRFGVRKNVSKSNPGRSLYEMFLPTLSNQLGELWI